MRTIEKLEKESDSNETQDATATHKRAQYSKSIYNRPGRIENSDLLEDKEDDILKQCLTEMYDYVILKHDAWSCFKYWYGCDSEVKRKLVRTIDENNVVLEAL